MGKALLVGLLAVLCTGCEYWAEWKWKQAQADLTQERADIMRLYKECLQANQGTAGRTQCEHYTQALHTFDVRGLR